VQERQLPYRQVKGRCRRRDSYPIDSYEACVQERQLPDRQQRQVKRRDSFPIDRYEAGAGETATR
jgi:hypothetical protein